MKLYKKRPPGFINKHFITVHEKTVAVLKK